MSTKPKPVAAPLKGRPRQRIIKAMQPYKLPELPPDHVQILFAVSTKCRICKLIGTDRELFDYINHHLRVGSDRAELLEHCRARGFDVRSQTFSRHKSWHLDPYLERVQRLQAQMQLLASQVADDPQGQNMAVLTARLCNLLVVPMVMNMEPEELEDLAPDQKVRLALQVAGTLGKTEATDAATRLAVMAHEMKAIELTRAHERLELAAFQAFRKRLQSVPAIWRRWQKFMAEVEGLLEIDRAAVPVLPPAAKEPS